VEGADEGSVGDSDGLRVGLALGDMEGNPVGDTEGNPVGDTEGMVVGDTDGVVVGDTDGMVVGDTDVAGAVLASLPSLLRSTKSLSLLSVPSMGNARSSTATAPNRQTTEERMERAIFFNSEHLHLRCGKLWKAHGPPSCTNVNARDRQRGLLAVPAHARTD